MYFNFIAKRAFFFLLSVLFKQMSLLWGLALVQCFFPRENQKYPWKRFFAVFLVFFTGRKFFSRVPFLKISRVGQTFHGYFFRFFHGLRFYFHGLKKGKKNGIFVNFTAQSFNFFTPRNLFFTGWIFADFSRERLLFHGLFLRNFHGYELVFTGGKPIFFTGSKNFSREKKKKTAHGYKRNPFKNFSEQKKFPGKSHVKNLKITFNFTWKSF